MSTYFDQVAVLGVKFPYKPFKGMYETLEPWIDVYCDWHEKPTPKVGCVYDGMSGEYVVLGRILGKTNGRRTIEQTPVEFDPASAQTMIDMAHALDEINQVLEKCGLPHAQADDMRLHVFTHAH